MLEGRKGEIEPIRTKEEIIAQTGHVNFNLENRWPIMTTEAGPTDRVAFHGIVDPFTIYTGGGLGGPLLRAAVTYENTTKDFAAAVMAADSQGLRILYYSLADDTRKIGIVPWELESGGTYNLNLGIDYQDGKLLVHVHNVGSLPVESVAVVAYIGDPDAGGTLIGKTVIDGIEAPNDLKPRIKTASIDWALPKSGSTVYVLIDPNDMIKNEITTFNNRAHALLPKKETPTPRQSINPEDTIKAGGRRGRR